jgi:hypothetical protein
VSSSGLWLKRQPLLFDRQIERAAEQHQCPIDIGGFPEIQTYPAGVWQEMMRLGLTGGHYFVAYLRWKRNIDEAIAVDVTEFALTDAIFRSTKAMRMGFDMRPAQ